MRTITRRLRNRRWTESSDYRTPDDRAGRPAAPSLQHELTASATRIQFR